jgi:hypothetical protein
MSKLKDKIYSADWPDHEVRPLVEFCRVNNVSAATVQRMRQRGGDAAPDLTYMSLRRIGVTGRANRIWQEKRRGSKPEVAPPPSQDDFSPTFPNLKHQKTPAPPAPQPGK